MSQVSTYQFGLQDIRVVELDGQPWFVAKDVFETLGYPKGSRTYQLLQLARDEVMVLEIQTVKMGTKAINESGLYKLIMRSDKPQARVFQDWVTRDVLPAIRKDGAYIQGEEKVATGELSEDDLVLKAIGILQRKVERLASEKAALQADNDRLLPAAQVGQAVGQRGRIGVVDFARKLPGVNSMQVQKDLQVMQYLFKRDGHWAVYAEYRGKLFDEILDGEGRSKIVVLEKGQQLLVDLYRRGYLPMKKGQTPSTSVELAV